MCCFKFRKSKSFRNNFLELVVKNNCGLLGLGTLKSAFLKNEMMKWADFVDTNEWKVKVTLRIIRSWSKMGDALQSMGLQVYLRNGLMNGADWFNDFWVLILMEQFLVWQPVYSVFWHLNAGGPLQLYLAEFFRKDSLWAKTTKYAAKWPLNRIFLLKNFLQKDFQPLRLQDSLITYFSWFNNWITDIFYM